MTRILLMQALDKFKQDPGTVVMLASLTASSTGITVTCASEVVLMEPCYNPFVSPTRTLEFQIASLVLFLVVCLS